MDQQLEKTKLTIFIKMRERLIVYSQLKLITMLHNTHRVFTNREIEIECSLVPMQKNVVENRGSTYELFS